MFGLENKSKDRDSKDFEFDLELEMKNPKKYQDLKDTTREQMRKIKTLLRAGDDKEEFHKLGTVLHGYVSLLKVLDRSARKK